MERPRPTLRLTTPVLLLTLLVLGCSGGEYVLKQDVPLSIGVTSPIYEEGGRLPHKYSCYEEDISPPVEWSGVPESTKSLAVIFEDLDGQVGVAGLRQGRGRWAHWVLYAVPPDVTGLEEGSSRTGSLPGSVREGTNDDKQLGYGSPCLLPPGSMGHGGGPSPGTGMHRFVFFVYALDRQVDLPPGATKSELLRVIDGSVLAGGRLTATYALPPKGREHE